MLTDGRGVPLSIVVAGANAPDMKLAQATLDTILIPRPRPQKLHPQHLCLDKGYDYDTVRKLVRRRGYTAHISVKGPPQPTARNPHRGKARRWMNERTHSWFNRFRRVLVRWEKKAANYLAVLHFVAAYYTFRQAKVFG